LAHAVTEPGASNLVTSGPPARAVLRLALPTIGAMLAQSIVNEVDIVFFAHLPCPESSNAQAALLPSLLILWAFGGSLSAISVGTQAFTGRRFAEGKREDAGAVLANSAFFALVCGIVFTACAFLLIGPIVSAVAPTEAVREAARVYLRWRLLGIVSMATTFAFKAFFDGIGKTHVHLVASVVMNAINVVLCLLLIFGRPELGIPKLGIEGAGIAGFVSTWVGLGVMVGWAMLPRYRREYRPFNVKKLDKSLTWGLVKLSIPGAVATVVIMTGVLLFVGIAFKLDEVHPLGVVSPLCPGGTAEPVNGAATTVIVGVLKLTFTACMAFGTSTATLVSQSLGEKKPDAAERFGWTSVKLGLLVFGTVGLLEFVFARQILEFVTKSELVQEVALDPMRIMGVATPIVATGMIVVEALFGAGNTRFVMIAQLCLHFGVLVPAAYVLGIWLDMGLVGIWLAALLYAMALAGTMTWKFRTGDWKAIQL
jgi:multidrug resistance protein, MATE family